MDSACGSRSVAITSLLLLASVTLFADHFDRGLELARAGEWDRAREEFLAGHREFPDDKRYLIELAGVEYRTGNWELAYNYLHQAQRLDPADAYVQDFLGSLHFFEGNNEAALLHWNKVGRPHIANIRIEPVPPVNPVLIDRALAFSAGETLTLKQYRTTVAWLNALDTFEAYRVDFSATENNAFDATVRWNEMPFSVRLMALGFSAPFQQAQLKRRNAGTDGGTVDAFGRWDAQRRAAYLAYSAPLLGRPQVRYSLEGEGRSETWNIGDPTDFRVQKWDAAAALRFVLTDRFSWGVGVQAAARRFPGAPQYIAGASLKESLTVGYQWLNLPEHRLISNTGVDVAVAKLYASNGKPGGYYGRAQWAMETRWFPRATGRDFESVLFLRAGAVWGDAPIDEWFMLTLNHDFDLPLRGHRGTRNGKLGSAPIARRYLLANLDVYKQLWSKPYIIVDAGPLADLGWAGQTLVTGDAGVLADIGAQIRFRLPVGIALVFSWAWDLRDGSGAFNSFVR